MKLFGNIFLFLGLLIQPAFLSAQTPLPLLEQPGPAGERPSHHFGPSRRRGRQGEFGLQARKFRQELRSLGKEIHRNQDTIKILKLEIDQISPGAERVELKKKLADARRRQVELKLILARRKVDITRRARDLAQRRYEDARLELNRILQRIKKKYPSLLTPAE